MRDDLLEQEETKKTVGKLLCFLCAAWLTPILSKPANTSTQGKHINTSTTRKRVHRRWDTISFPSRSRRGCVRSLAMHLLALRAGILDRTKLLVRQRSKAESTEDESSVSSVSSCSNCSGGPLKHWLRRAALRAGRRTRQRRRTYGILVGLPPVSDGRWTVTLSRAYC